MLINRIIPSLLLNGNGLVKTVRFSKPVYVGDPINAIHIFNEKEVDELLVLDIQASKQKRRPNFELIESIASECFMPLCYGGGITTLNDAQRLFSSGVEKVSLQAVVFDDTRLISEIAGQFGSQSVVLSVDVKRDWLGRPRLYSASRGRVLSRSWLDYLMAGVGAGAGEVLLNAVHRDGTMEGMDIDLVAEAAAAVDVPVIATGGASSIHDMRAAVCVGASAVAAGALFVFYGPHRAVLITYPSYSELEDIFGAVR